MLIVMIIMSMNQEYLDGKLTILETVQETANEKNRSTWRGLLASN